MLERRRAYCASHRLFPPGEDISAPSSTKRAHVCARGASGRGWALVDRARWVSGMVGFLFSCSALTKPLDRTLGAVFVPVAVARATRRVRRNRKSRRLLGLFDALEAREHRAGGISVWTVRGGRVRRVGVGGCGWRGGGVLRRFFSSRYRGSVRGWRVGAGRRVDVRLRR